MTSIQMPQLGETIVEGTILKWLKQEGDAVAADEPLFEISTDKVDTEVPSPVAGTVTKLLVAEGATVPVGTAVMEIDDGTGLGLALAPRGAARRGGRRDPTPRRLLLRRPSDPRRPPPSPPHRPHRGRRLLRRTRCARSCGGGAESGGGGGSRASVADLVSDRATVGEGARDRSGDRGRVR